VLVPLSARNDGCQRRAFFSVRLGAPHVLPVQGSRLIIARFEIFNLRAGGRHPGIYRPATRRWRCAVAGTSNRVKENGHAQ
jgi:hypothetical protein